MMVNSSQVLDRIVKAIPQLVAGFLVVLTAVWWLFGQDLVSQMYIGNFQSFFIVPAPQRERYTPDQLFVLMGKALLGTTLISIVVAGSIAWFRRLQWGEESCYKIRVLLTILACTTICTACLYAQGVDAEGYPMAKAVSFTADPPFRHRVLFVWIAKSILLTGVPLRVAYIATQWIALLLAMTAMWKLAELYIVRERTFLAPIVLSGMVAPTYIYYTFYDMGIIFFYAAGLALLFTRQPLAYLLLIGVATLNHENILFLILFSTLILYGEKGWLWMVAGQFAIYGAVRAVLFQVLPVSSAWFAGNVWPNMEFLVAKPYRLTATALLFLWFVTAIYVGWRRAPIELKLSLILLPMLIASTLLVGQIDEARQFDAFIPVAVLLLLHALAGPRERGVRWPAASHGG